MIKMVTQKDGEVSKEEVSRRPCLWITLAGKKKLPEHSDYWMLLVVNRGKQIVNRDGMGWLLMVKDRRDVGSRTTTTRSLSQS